MSDNSILDEFNRFHAGMTQSLNVFGQRLVMLQQAKENGRPATPVFATQERAVADVASYDTPWRIRPHVSTAAADVLRRLGWEIAPPLRAFAPGVAGHEHLWSCSRNGESFTAQYGSREPIVELLQTVQSASNEVLELRRQIVAEGGVFCEATSPRPGDVRWVYHYNNHPIIREGYNSADALHEILFAIRELAHNSNNKSSGSPPLARIFKDGATVVLDKDRSGMMGYDFAKLNLGDDRVHVVLESSRMNPQDVNLVLLSGYHGCFWNAAFFREVQKPEPRHGRVRKSK